MAMKVPPFGAQAVCRLPAGRQTNSPAPHFDAGVGAFLVDQRALQHVSLLDQDVLVVGQLGARRHLEQQRRQPALGSTSSGLTSQPGKRVFCHGISSGRR